MDFPERSVEQLFALASGFQGLYISRSTKFFSTSAGPWIIEGLLKYSDNLNSKDVKSVDNQPPACIYAVWVFINAIQL